jgi:hypothetical protein
MKVGLFIDTQLPEGFNLAEHVPEMVRRYARRAKPDSHPSGSRITG